MENYESGETTLRKSSLQLLAEVHDSIIASRTQDEVDHGNPEKGIAITKLRHAAYYLVDRKENDASDRHSDTSKTKV